MTQINDRKVPCDTLGIAAGSLTGCKVSMPRDQFARDEVLCPLVPPGWTAWQWTALSRLVLLLPCLLALFLLSGCFVANVPAITESTADDVGQRLVAVHKSKYSGMIRLVVTMDRVEGKRYRFGVYENKITIGPGDVPDDTGMGYVRSLPRADGMPAYVLQVETDSLSPPMTDNPPGFPFLLLFIAVDKTGEGFLGVPECWQGAAELAVRHGLTMSGGGPDGYDSLRSDQGSADPLWPFLVDYTSRPDSCFVWEDILGKRYAPH